MYLYEGHYGLRVLKGTWVVPDVPCFVPFGSSGKRREMREILTVESNRGAGSRHDSTLGDAGVLGPLKQSLLPFLTHP